MHLGKFVQEQTKTQSFCPMNGVSLPKTILFLFLAFSISIASANKNPDDAKDNTKKTTQLISGVFKLDKSKLEHALITITNEKNEQVFYDLESSKFDIQLEYFHTYKIQFSAEGYTSKILVLDLLTDVPETIDSEQILDITVKLKEAFTGLENILTKPIAIASFNKETNSIEFDYEYTQTVQHEIKILEKTIKSLKMSKANF